MESCAFCEILAGRQPATVVAADEHTIAFLDLRQFHPGHVLVVPREHVPDIRDATDALAASVLVMVARVARAVNAAWPCDGLSVWHSAGAGANQEVPHLHFHVHPRHAGDDLLRIYPSSPRLPDRAELEAWGRRLRETINPAHSPGPERGVGADDAAR
jgi:histidine triad (HIT) family protein